MPAIRANNEYVDGDIVSLHDGTRTASGTGSFVSVGTRHTARLDLNVTAASGTTPSLTVNIQHSPDGSTWTTHSSFTAATATGAQRRVISGLDRFLRVSWTISGTTPSFTFTVTGELV